MDSSRKETDPRLKTNSDEDVPPNIHLYSEIQKRRIGWEVRIIRHIDKDTEELDRSFWRPTLKRASEVALRAVRGEV